MIMVLFCKLCDQIEIKRSRLKHSVTYFSEKHDRNIIFPVIFLNYQMCYSVVFRTKLKIKFLYK